MANQRFDREWKVAVDITKDITTNNVKSAAIQLMKQITDGTPVLTGHLKHNWQASVGAPMTAEIKGVDPSGKGVKSNNSKAVRSWNIWKNSLYFANTAPYGLFIEYGWSGKAPQGMVRINLLQWDTIVNTVVQKSKDRKAARGE